MAQVTVTRTDDGGYEVTLNERTFTLPTGSKRSEDNNLTRFGTPTNYIEVDVGPYEFSLVSDGTKEVLVAEDESFDEGELDRRGELYTSLEDAWREASKEKAENPSLPGGRRSRLKKKTRRAKRNTRNNKRRKLRKFTTRRR
jgi:hypothetical protein